MKIGVIVPGGVDRSGRGRVIPVLLALVERLARRHEVLVVALDQEPQACEYDLLGAHVVNLGSSTKPSLIKWGYRLKKFLNILKSHGGDFDVLHAFWAHPPGIMAVAAGAYLGTPVIISVGGGEMVRFPEIGYGGQLNWHKRTAISFALHRAIAVTAGSHYALCPLKKIRNDAHWLPLGVETRVMSGVIARSEGPPWRLLHVAGLNRVKDQTTLLHAFRIVLQSHPQTLLDCIGGDTLSSRMQALAQTLGIADKVMFHGFRPLDELLPFYRQAHLFIQSSLHESMGAAVLEAAASGVPTVGTNVGVVAEMAPLAAHAVPLRDPHALARGIVELLDCTERRESLARAAQLFAQTYNADWTCAQFEALYQQVVRRRGDCVEYASAS